MNANFFERVFRATRELCAIAVCLIFVGFLVTLTVWAWPAIRDCGSNELFSTTNWNPELGRYGSLGFLYGTITTCLIALAVAVPLGIGCAAYLSEIAPRQFRLANTTLLEWMAAVPSVVYGYWGKAVLAPKILLALEAMKIPGVSIGYGGLSLLTAGLVLALMVLPYITTVAYGVFRNAPRELREGACALGATRWQILCEVVLPHGKRAVIAGCFLALSRALGETMAVAMVVGHSDVFHWSPLVPGDTFPSVIANSFTEVSGQSRSALVALGLLLLIATTLSNFCAKWLTAWAARPRIRSGASVDSMRVFRKRAKIGTAFLSCCYAATIIPLALVLVTIIIRGGMGIHSKIFTQLPQPFDSPGGLGNAILGSAFMLAMAAAVAVPVGFGAGYYMVEAGGKWLGNFLRTSVEFLEGVPSIIVGIFGYAVCVERWGYSAWAGAFALGILMLPILVKSSEAAFRNLPVGLRETSYSLGASPWQTVWRLVGPIAWPMLCAGALMAIGRALGEAAPLLLTASGSNFWPGNPYQATASLPYFLNDASRSLGRAEYESLGWVAALLLMVGAGSSHLLAKSLIPNQNRPV